MNRYKNERSRRINRQRFLYSVVKKIGSDKIMEVQKIDIKTKRKQIIFQDKDYKKLIDKIANKVKN